MKVRKLLKHFDFLGDIRVVEYDENKSADPEVLFEGVVLDVPWSLAEMKLDTSLDFEAVGIHRNEDGKISFEVSVTE